MNAQNNVLVQLPSTQMDILHRQQLLVAGQRQHCSISELAERNQFLRNSGKVSLIQVDLVPRMVCRHLSIRPVSIKDDVLTINALHPLSDYSQNYILESARGLGHNVNELVVIPEDMAVIQHYLRHTDDSDRSVLESLLALAGTDEDTVDDTLLTDILDKLIGDAVRSRATDIRLRITDSDIGNWIDYRIDNIYRQRYLLNAVAMAKLRVRLKMMAQMDISKAVSPQDGRLERVCDGRRVDIRVGTMPAGNGGIEEMLVMRLLDSHNLMTPQEIFAEYPQSLLNRILTLTHVKKGTGGIVLINGATSSGKTTTKYGLVLAMPREQLNIISIEDPIEYRIQHIHQTQINRAASVDFNNFLRASLRNDPDVLLVAELRDAETVQTAIRAADSGHRFMSTLHTGTASQSISRMINMLPADENMETNRQVLAQQLEAIICQRLVTRLCGCSLSYDAHSEAHRNAVTAYRTFSGRKIDLSTLRFPNPDGCAACENEGYLGRVVMPECLLLPRRGSANVELNRLVLQATIDPAPLYAHEDIYYYSFEDAAHHLISQGIVCVSTILELFQNGSQIAEDDNRNEK